MLSERCCCSLSEKSLSSCYCWHRCYLLTAQVLVLAQVLAQVLVLELALALALLLGPKLWR
jgi:hypothetical protein